MGCGVQKVTFDWKAIIFGICQNKIHVTMTAFSLYKKSARIKETAARYSGKQSHSSMTIEFFLNIIFDEKNRFCFCGA